MKDKSKEELIELLEERDNKIDELKQEIETNSDDYMFNTAELNEMYSGHLDKRELEELTEKTYAAGYQAKENNEPKLKSWLNYKIGARI